MTSATPIPAEPDQYDTPWKEAVERYFPEFMGFYFPQAHSQIDWSQGYTFLEQELQAIAQDAALGKRYVDKLVRVTQLTGQVRLTPARLPWSPWPIYKPAPPAKTRKRGSTPSGSWCNCCTAGAGRNSASSTYSLCWTG